MRRLSICIAMVVLAAACGHNNSTARRVVSSPQATPSLAPVVTTTPSATRASPTAAPTHKPVNFATATRAPRASVSPATLARARVKLTKVVTLDQPLALALRANDANSYFAEKTGKVVSVRNGSVNGTVLDMSSEISTGSEQGLLGLAFSSDGTRMYVYFTSATSTTGANAGDDVLREYSFSGGHATGPRDVFRVADPDPNHNGGNIVFGYDGYLYVGIGDGGGAGDVHSDGTRGNGQNTNVLLGKMLRIDPRQSGSKQYSIPSSNPFVHGGGRGEIWAYGLRNPWRWSFDRSTHDLWIADVGQDAWEEVDVQAASSHGGDNYGWNRMEGNHSYNGGTPPSPYHPPVYEYDHSGGNCAITGGYVYRGTRIGDLQGAYVFGDFCAGMLRAFVLKNGTAAGARFLGPQVSNLASFAQDASGELYALSLDGGVYRIDPA